MLTCCALSLQGKSSSWKHHLATSCRSEALTRVRTRSRHRRQMAAVSMWTCHRPVTDFSCWNRLRRGTAKTWRTSLYSSRSAPVSVHQRHRGAKLCYKHRVNACNFSYYQTCVLTKFNCVISSKFVMGHEQSIDCRSKANVQQTISVQLVYG